VGGILERTPAGAIDVADLVTWSEGAARRVLVTGDAWIGKTFVANALVDAARAIDLDVWVTKLQMPDPGRPTAEFFSARRKRIWIIDGADECLHQDRLVPQLPDRASSSHDPDLLIIVFTRSDDSLRMVEPWLGPDGVLELLPLDEAQLLALCENDAAVARRVADRAAAIADGRDVALAPAELLVLRRGHHSSLLEVREAVVRERCTRVRDGAPAVATDDQLFAMAQRLAAVAMFSGEHDMRLGGGGDHGWSIGALVEPNELAAAQGLERTRALVRRGDALCFAALHLEEDLAALATARREHTTLRSLFHDGREVRPSLARVWRRVCEMVPTDQLGQLRDEVERLTDADAIALYRSLEAKLAERPDDVPYEASADMLRAMGTASVRTHVAAVLRRRKLSSSVARLALRTLGQNEWLELDGLAVRRASDVHLLPPVREQALTAARPARRDGEPRFLHWRKLDALAAALALVRQTEAAPAARDRRWSSEGSEMADVEPFATSHGDEHALDRMLETILVASWKAGRRTVLELADVLPRWSIRQYAGIKETLRDAMTLEDARLVVDDLEREPQPPRIYLLANHAVTMVLDALPESLSERDVRHVLSITRSLHLAGGEVMKRWQALMRGRQDIGRLIFERSDLETNRTNGWLTQHKGELEWLLTLGASRTTWPKVLADAIADGAGALTSSEPELVARARAALVEHGFSSHVEDRAALWADMRKQAAQWNADAEAHAARASERVPIDRWLDAFDPRRGSASQQLWEIGSVIGPIGRPDPIAGAVDDVPVDARERMCGWIRDALAETAPSSLAMARSIFEGQAFSWAVAFSVASENGCRWLDRELIERWLPSALRGHLESMPVTAACFVTDAAATVHAVLEELERSALTLGYGETHHVPEMVRRAPSFLDGLAALVRKVAASNDGNAWRAAPSLFATLLANDPSWQGNARVARFIDEVAVDREQLRRALLSIWMQHAPNDASRSVVDACRTESDAVELLWRASDMRRRNDVRDIWSSATLTSIIGLGLAAFAGHDWSERQFGLMSERKLTLELLQQIAWLCIERRNDASYSEAMAQLRAVPYWNDQIEQIDHRDALAALIPIAHDPAPPRRIGELLRDDLVLIRDASELARALVRAVVRPVWTEMDFRLLVIKGEPVVESAVQALVALRLHAWRDHQKTFPLTIVREPLERGTDRPDFLIVSADGPASTPIDVPIEIKWAHNTKLIRDLEQQLIGRYLRERRHGLLVVVDREPRGAARRHARLEVRIAALNRKHGKSVRLVYIARPEVVDVANVERGRLSERGMSAVASKSGSPGGPRPSERPRRTSRAWRR
jgi:hypothetical protein